MTTDLQAFRACKHAVISAVDTWKGLEISRCEGCKWFTAGEDAWMAPGWEAS